ncbi:MAG TPA: VWA domain-containing protein [Pyrinomonadaceae bacterium]|nr:VWA domain-containing protein [Pyrinomonadaceae bacterium]
MLRKEDVIRFPAISSAHARLSLTLLCFVLFFSSRASAQNPAQNSQQPDDVVRVNVELVQTDVMVFDERGNFVEVKPEQFKLRLDGAERPISLISRVTSGSKLEAAQLAAARSGNAAAISAELATVDSAPLSSPGRLIFFFVDDLHLSTASLARSRTALLRFVDHQMGLHDQVAIVSTSGQIGFLQQLTDNRLVLQKAIDRLKDKRNHEGYIDRTRITEYMASQIQNAQDSRLFAYLMESTKIEYGMGGGALRGAHNNDSAGQALRLLTNRIRQIGTQNNADRNATLNALGGLLQSSANFPGRKLIFFLSDGFVVDPRGSNALDRLHELGQTAAQAGAVIYTMDTRGTSSDASVDASHNDYVDMTSRHGGISLGETVGPRQPLSVLAKETGGQAIFNSNRIDHAIDRAIKETSEYYVLAWRPSEDAERIGKARIEISVLGRPDLTVRLRTSYQKQVSQPPVPEKQRLSTPKKSTAETELLAALGSSYQHRSLPTSLSVGFVKNSKAGLQLQASMQIERDAFRVAPGVAGQKTEIDVMGAAIDDRGLIYSFKQVLTVVPQTTSELTQTPVMWRQKLTVQPGLYQVRVAVRERQTGRSGSAMQWIEVPAIDQKRFGMSSLFLGERRPGPLPEDKRGAESIRSDVDHRFSRSSVLRFQTYVYNASRSAGAPNVWIQARVLRGTQQVLALEPGRIPPDVTNDPTRLPFWTEISLEQLPAGRYILQVQAADRSANTNTSQSIGFSIE